MLIVGGGPFGTAAAFRAKELGLAALVIDYDDLMKRIRDYAKDKQILPDYGGGDRMQFPDGGPARRRAAFRADRQGPDVARMEGALSRQFSVPAQIGVELTGLERDGDGVWQRGGVEPLHEGRAELSRAARRARVRARRAAAPRHSRQCAGPGVRLDRRGSSTSADPVCVIGGGTSAAEAVIAISNAKAQARRINRRSTGRTAANMPKVSQALAAVLFDVFMSNGNVRFLLGSDPIAVTTRDGQEFVAIRTAVTEQPGQPREVVQLEFTKAFCVACIGADRPDPLLEKSRCRVRAEGIRRRRSARRQSAARDAPPGLYLAGDLLSPDYAETTNFDGHPSTFVMQVAARQHQGGAARRRAARRGREAAARGQARTSAS